MSTWNRYDPEVIEEMLKPWRRIGTQHAPTYRAQAKSELARRYVLEDELKELKQEKSDLETVVEHLCEYIRWPIEEWEEKRKSIPDYVLEHIDKRYDSQDPERRKQWRLQRYKTHGAAKAKIYREKNRERISAYAKAYRIANLWEVRLANRLANRRMKERKRAETARAKNEFLEKW